MIATKAVCPICKTEYDFAPPVKWTGPGEARCVEGECDAPLLVLLKP